jgi:rhomboid protease GluP
MEIVLILIGINILVFIIPYIWNFGSGMYPSQLAFLQMGWKDNAEIRDGEYYRLLSSNFLHADLVHLAVNMISLYQVGPLAYQIFGPAMFLGVYLISGISGSLTSFLFNPGPSVGASGAIFGVVGAIFAFALIKNQPAIYSQLFLVIIINLIIGFASPGARIDNWGHIGGLVAGFAIGAILVFGGNLNPLLR